MESEPGAICPRRLLRLLGLPFALSLTSWGTLLVLNRLLPEFTGAPMFSTAAICSGDAVPVGAPEACGALELTSLLTTVAAGSVLCLIVIGLVNFCLSWLVAAKRLRFALACRITFALAMFGFYGLNASIIAVTSWLLWCLSLGAIWYVARPGSDWMAAPLGFMVRWVLLPVLVLQVLGKLMMAVTCVAGDVFEAGGRVEFLPGHALTRADAPTFWSALTQWCSMLQLPVPQHVLVGLTGSTYYRDYRVISLDGVHTGGTLYCSLPMARLLGQADLCADIAHCLRAVDVSHLDPSFTRTFSETSQRLIREGEAFGIEAFSLPARTLLEIWCDIWLPLSAEANNEWVGHLLEQGALTGGMRQVALNLIARFRCTHYWDPFLREVRQRLRAGCIEDAGKNVPAKIYYVNLSQRFVEYICRQAGPDVAATILDIEEPAIQLFDNAETWEQRLSSRERRQLVFE